MSGLLRMLQADLSRRNQGADQQNSHCRALEDAMQHDLIVPLRPVLAVI
jgi:hypothetical protein